MIAVVATLAGVGLAALLGMLGYFLKSALDTLADVRKQVSDHDSTDQVLTTNVENLTRELREFKEQTGDSLAALNAKLDTVILNTSRQSA